MPVESGQAMIRFKSRVRQWSDRIGVAPKRVQVQRMTSKWASCSTNGRVCFSLDLIQKPPKFQDSVIVHELVHLQVPNHGKLYKSLVRAFIPNKI